MSNKQQSMKGKTLTTCQDSQKPATNVKTQPPVKPKKQQRGYRMDKKEYIASNSQSPQNKAKSNPPIKPIIIKNEQYKGDEKRSQSPAIKIKTAPPEKPKTK